jgi:hypothetical protein
MYTAVRDSVSFSEEPSISWDENEELKNESKPTYSLSSRIYYHIASILLTLTFPASIIAGCGITAGTTYALVRWVQHLIATAKVNGDPVVWMQDARTKAYDACYYGCNDCSDPSWAYNACNMTSKAIVPGMTCDGNKMWNWVERYPLECLHAVGEFYKADALKRLKQSYRNRLAIIILTILAGVVGTIIVYMLWKKAATSLKEKARVARENSLVWPTKKHNFSEVNEKAASTPSGGRFNRKLALLGGLAVLSGKANAYPCTGYDDKVDKYFVNTNKTIFGVVHGYLADCYDYTCDCFTTCSGGTMPSCSTSCSTCTGVDIDTLSYVNKVLPKVEDCGFEVVDAVEGDVNFRIASALIERDWWVKISVNTYNLTAAETDPSILCLHAIGG